MPKFMFGDNSEFKLKFAAWYIQLDFSSSSSGKKFESDLASVIRSFLWVTKQNSAQADSFPLKYLEFRVAHR